MGNEDNILIHDLKARLYEATVNHMGAFRDDDPRGLARYSGQIDLLCELIFHYS